jgi:hypothetical protein
MLLIEGGFWTGRPLRYNKANGENEERKAGLSLSGGILL